MSLQNLKVHELTIQQTRKIEGGYFTTAEILERFAKWGREIEEERKADADLLIR